MLSILFSHLYSIAIGLAVCLPCIAMFFVIGNGLLPTRFAPQRGGAILRCSIGVAVFMAVCWYSLKFRIPLAPTLNYLLGAAALLAVFSLVRLGRNGHLRTQVIRDGLHFAAIFCAYYTIAYAMLPSLFTADELPISQVLANADILHYIHYSSYFQRLGPENIFNGDYLGGPYWVTPSAHYFFDLVAIGFGGNAMSATMPLIYSLIAIVGLAVANLAKAIFRLSTLSSVLLGAVTISGVFFEYVYGNGFVPQYLSSALLLTGILQVVGFWNESGERSWLRIVGIVALYSFMLFYTYPAMFLIFFASLGILVFVKDVLFGGAQTERWSMAAVGDALRRFPRVVMWWGSAVLAGLLLMALVDVSHTIDVVFDYIPNLAGADVGWSLDMLPAYTLLGLPGPMQLSRLGTLTWIAVGSLVAMLLVYLYAFRSRSFSSLQRAFAMLGAVAYLAYLAFVFKQGVSYQQWKFASYFPLIWMWVFFPVAAQLIATRLPALRLADRSRGLALLTACAAAAIVLTNFSHARSIAPSQTRFDGAFADMAVIDSFSEVRVLYTTMFNFQATFLPLFFVQTKLVHLLDNSYYWHDDYDPEKISESSPVFWQGADCGEPGSTQIGKIGCLFRRPPSARFDQIYALESTPKIRLFVDAKDFGRVEITGVRPVVRKGHLSVTVTADVAQKHPAGYLNLHVHPSDAFDNAATAQFRVNGKLFEAAKLDEDRWISIPWVLADWTGEHAKTLALTIDAPAFDLVPPGDGLEFFSEQQSIGVLDVSVSDAPVGEVLQPR